MSNDLVPLPKNLLDEIRVVRQGLAARINAEREMRRHRARESLMAGNRRFWSDEQVERDRLVGLSAEAQQKEGAPEYG